MIPHAILSHLTCEGGYVPASVNHHFPVPTWDDGLARQICHCQMVRGSMYDCQSRDLDSQSLRGLLLHSVVMPSSQSRSRTGLMPPSFRPHIEKKKRRKRKMKLKLKMQGRKRLAPDLPQSNLTLPQSRKLSTEAATSSSSFRVRL